MVWHDEQMLTFAGIALRLIEDGLRLLVLLLRSTEAVCAESLFMPRQLALFIERGLRPRRVDAATRVSLVMLAKVFEWRRALAVVQLATLLGRHRAGWRLFWRLKSQRGRPPIPAELRAPGTRRPGVAP
jgi:putative transposase